MTTGRRTLSTVPTSTVRQSEADLVLGKMPACDGAAERLGWVNEDSRSRRRTAELTDRLDECGVLDRLIDPVLVWRAAGHLGIGAAAARPAADADLIEFGARMRFRHPLVRSAVDPIDLRRAARGYRPRPGSSHGCHWL